MKTSFCLGSTPVPITALAMGSAPLVTRPPAECTVNVISTGKARPVTSRTAGTIAAAPTTATATSLGRSCASAMTVGKVTVSSVQTQQMFASFQIAKNWLKPNQVIFHCSGITCFWYLLFHCQHTLSALTHNRKRLN